MIFIYVFLAFVGIALIAAVIIGVYWGNKTAKMKKEVQEKWNNATPEERAVMAKKAMQEWEDFEKKNANLIIEKAIILNTDSTKSASSSISRGVIGGAIFGVGGAVGGALSGKNINKTTFLLIYKDGHRETQEVENGSDLYNCYIQYLDV